MKLTYNTPYEGKIRTLKFKRDPSYYGLGYYEDINKVTWDVVGIYGPGDGKRKSWIQARPVDSSHYYSTANDGHSYGSHRWLPYYFKVIKEE